MPMHIEKCPYCDHVERSTREIDAALKMGKHIQRKHRNEV